MPKQKRVQHRLRARSFAPARLLTILALLMLLPAAAAMPDDAGSWVWPVDGARTVAEPFRAPAHDYGPGHRGVDIATATGTVVRAPADGVVAFRGVVVDRALLTIDHGDGVISTFEPLASELVPGTAVRAGDAIGTVASGGHAATGTMHLGVRVDGVYTNPMLMFGDVPRAILLPCCDAITRAGARAGRSL
ncbi:murein hydrolase activator EnvC family protein [Microbacterium sp.]|uniref:murein hydrolase activator EnvC family protein n=1 Tax=Microbacterium sp. TaxID=51671 RepID=UPI003F986845